MQKPILLSMDAGHRDYNPKGRKRYQKKARERNRMEEEGAQSLLVALASDGAFSSNRWCACNELPRDRNPGVKASACGAS